MQFHVIFDILTIRHILLWFQELVSARNNNKTCLSDLEFKYDKVAADRGQRETELADLRQELDSLRKENNRVMEENKNAKISVSDLQAELKGAKHRWDINTDVLSGWGRSRE